MNWSVIIKTLRGKLLITQKELALILQVSCASINRWENGKFEPTMKIKRKIIELCRVYGIEVEES